MLGSSEALRSSIQKFLNTDVGINGKRLLPRLSVECLHTPPPLPLPILWYDWRMSFGIVLYDARVSLITQSSKQFMSLMSCLSVHVFDVSYIYITTRRAVTFGILALSCSCLDLRRVMHGWMLLVALHRDNWPGTTKCHAWVNVAGCFTPWEMTRNHKVSFLDECCWLLYTVRNDQEPQSVMHEWMFLVALHREKWPGTTKCHAWINVPGCFTPWELTRNHKVSCMGECCWLLYTVKIDQEP